ncbi:coiled-coil domain-containing protein 34 isoform X1 [Hydra vulgaris]|uniref:coiled-coil domain-containing protein 34 isoform X1 n=1 Tax=Hydra vulgaris TaxID=6087 RepID=UPI001F5F671F|nr:coiled-coil domain-containing protein 34 [Hydra vulgaris]
MYWHKGFKCSSPNLTEKKSYIFKDFPVNITFEADTILSESVDCSNKSLSVPNKANNNQSSNMHDTSQKKSWDDWVLNKALLDLKKKDLKKKKKNDELIEKKKLLDEKAKKEQLAKEVREEWLKKKIYLAAKMKKEAAAQDEFERLKSAQKKEVVYQRSKESLSKWLEEKKNRDHQMKLTKNEARRQTEIEKINKCIQSDIIYKNWLNEAKKKKLPGRYSYGYANGSLFTYYDMTATPNPSFTNSEPWLDQSGSDSVNEKIELFCSPPMLWKDVNTRQQAKDRTTNKTTKNLKKHSCSKLS